MGLKFSGWVVVAFLIAAFIPATSRAQAKNGPPMPPPDYATKYDRSPAGLLVQLQMILTNAKDPEKAKLLIKALEMPKYDDYFHAVYQPDVELFWTGSYTRALMSANANFQSLFASLGTQEGEFVIRQINGAPEGKFEEALAGKLKGPVEIYAVSWKKRKAADNAGDDLLGYYAYLSGRFRWFYMLDFPKMPGETAKTSAKPAGAASKAASSKAASSGGATGSPAAKPSTVPPPAQNQ